MKAFGFCRGSAGKTPQKTTNKSFILFIHSSETWTLRSSGLNNLFRGKTLHIWSDACSGSINNYRTTLEN